MSEFFDKSLFYAIAPSVIGAIVGLSFNMPFLHAVMLVFGATLAGLAIIAWIGFCVNKWG